MRRGWSCLPRLKTLEYFKGFIEAWLRIALLVVRIEDIIDKVETYSDITPPMLLHCEKTKCIQGEFVRDEQSLATTTEEIENPFMKVSMDEGTRHSQSN